MAIYGLIIDTVQRHQFLHREQFSTMIFEEAAELMAYPAGARTAHRITRQGRKHATGIWLVSQDYRDFARMGTNSSLRSGCSRSATRNWRPRRWSGPV